MVKSVSCPTPGDDRKPRLEHRLRHGLLVERPQVLDRAATAHHQQHVDLGPHVGGPDRLRDFGGGALALDRGRIEDHRQRRPAASQRGEHVAQRRRAQRRHDADRARVRRQRALARGIEPARGVEARLQSGEAFIQRADAREPCGFDVELELAPRLVEACGGPHLDGDAVLQRKADVLRLVAEEHAAHLRARVLQVEIAVARRRAGEVGDLARDPDQPDVALQQQADGGDETRHRKDGVGARRRPPVGIGRRREWRGCGKGIGHGEGTIPATAGFRGGWPRGRASTMRRRRSCCPGRRTRAGLSRWCHPDPERASDSPRRARGERSQLLDATMKKVGQIMGTATNFPSGAALSDRIYKICTLLSTGFVENHCPPRAATPRKPLSGAGFRAMPRPPGVRVE